MNISLGDIDKVVPPLTSTLTDGTAIKVTRVRDEYYTEQVPIPFEHQELKNDALPEGERRLSQPGENGLEEITHHRQFEDNVEVMNSIVKSVVIKEAVPEIVMIGNRQAFSPVDIPGKLAYLSSGNGWIMETNTGQRSCVVCTGDLDGRIFVLSPDGRFLLFTRSSKNSNSINSLWAASLRYDPARLIDLGVENVIHYAEFSPDSSTIAYSTAEWREAAPGWQANNDLYDKTISSTGFLGHAHLDLETNSGGMYGWWGTFFSWSPGGDNFIYSRPDSLGTIDPEAGTQSIVHAILPYQTGGYWAWVPGISWSPDGTIIYTVDHKTTASASGGEIQEFDLVGIPTAGGDPVPIVKNVGMFAYPVTSKLYQIGESSEPTGVPQNKETFSVAYLQAIFPDQSDTSGYRLFTIDRDGSNPHSLFPEEGSPGIKPQRIAWSPALLPGTGELALAVIYNGNIWILHSDSGESQQITSDGLTSRIDWR